MSEQHTFFSRLGTWFRKGTTNRGIDGELPLERSSASSSNGTDIEPRSTFLRPWARQERMIHNLQEGFSTLTDLMSAVRDNLDRQAQRQDELLKYLSHLPQALQNTVDINRTQTETLKAIHQQMESQNSGQKQLAEILDRLCNTTGTHQEALDGLRERVESINEQDRVISDTLHNVGAAMENVSKTSQTSAEVLQQMRDNVNSRDGQLERILHKQSVRFTTMLSIAIFLSIAALVSVAVVGYLLVTRQGVTL